MQSWSFSRESFAIPDDCCLSTMKIKLHELRYTDPYALSSASIPRVSIAIIMGKWKAKGQRSYLCKFLQAENAKMLHGQNPQFYYQPLSRWVKANHQGISQLHLKLDPGITIISFSMLLKTTQASALVWFWWIIRRGLGKKTLSGLDRPKKFHF